MVGHFLAVLLAVIVIVVVADDLNSVEHIVLFMQENRPFGTILRGRESPPREGEKEKRKKYQENKHKKKGQKYGNE